MVYFFKRLNRSEEFYEKCIRVNYRVHHLEFLNLYHLSPLRDWPKNFKRRRHKMLVVKCFRIYRGNREATWNLPFASLQLVAAREHDNSKSEATCSGNAFVAQNLTYVHTNAARSQLLRLFRWKLPSESRN